MIKEVIVKTYISIKEALKRLDSTGQGVLLVVDDQDRLLGAITDGDIRRFILSGKGLENNIQDIYNKNPHYINKEDFTLELAKEKIIENKIELLPIVDKEHRIIEFITWDQLFSKDELGLLKSSRITIPVVIMAGGKGTRLEPFTRILPKPLIPIGDKPIIEIIIDEFKKQGVCEYHVLLNHKGEMIQAYFDGIEKDYGIRFIKENTFLGTAGGLRLLDKKIGNLLIVSNCDIIVKANFEDAINFHKEQKSVLTILTAIQHHKIPYGIVEFKEGGKVVEIIEKPEYTFTVNTGVYILDKKCLELIPEGIPSDMTDLIKNLINSDMKVGIYPVNEKDYIDIGQWGEYKMAVESLQRFSG
ncbi:MAG: sugar phosphate nucleotidyltransferase [Candidatus Omnitrophota bacterium]